MNSKSKGLIFKVGVIFAVFAVISVTLGGIATYCSQMKSYRRECEKDIDHGETRRGEKTGRYHERTRE